MSNAVVETIEKKSTIPVGVTLHEELTTEMTMLNRSRYYLQVYFSRNPAVIHDKPEYQHIIFNWVGLHLPYNGVIWEHVGMPIGIPQESSDKYLCEDAVKIILPINLMEVDVPSICRENIEQWKNGVVFVVAVLRKLGILREDEKIEHADDLYFRLKEYKIPVDVVVGHYAKKRQSYREEMR